MIEQILLIIGASIFGVLGTIHLIYTFFSNKFNAYDESVTAAMKGTSPILTKETTMWNAWVGFNASHSLGAMIVAIFYILLATLHMPVILETKAFSLLAVLIGLSYLFLAKNYWFRIPFTGILAATICFSVSAALVYF